MEYAADLRKKIIPIRVQDYKPDGWLGLITAGESYYDFTDEKQFDAKFRELLSAVLEITEGGRQDSPDGPTAEEPIVAEHVKPVTDEDRFYAYAENNLHLDGYESDALALAIEKLQTTA
nr:hypothetical protein BaRGS_021254 [Batillaria attramentaria]